MKNKGEQLLFGEYKSGILMDFKDQFMEMHFQI